jgi:glycosyltransferase involved in cell wall biosynthesis
MQLTDPGRSEALEEPLVSVILPIYNGERFIEATLTSALAQAYRRLEIIVVDDGSRDRSREIVEAFAARDPRVRLIVQANRGVAAARNRGIAEARGEFVAPLDADDVWDPSKIERQVRRMRECGEATGVVYSWWVWIDDASEVLDVSPRWRIESDAANALLHVNYIGCASIPLFRRSVVDALGGYDETLITGCEDWDLSLRVAERAGVAVVPSYLVAYRRRVGSMSTDTDAMWRARGMVVERLRRRRPDIERRVHRRSDAQFALHLAGVAFWDRQFARSVGWGLRALKSTLGFEVLPYILPMLARSWWRSGAPKERVEPGVAFADRETRPTLIPYDRIIGRRLERRSVS